MAFPAALMGAAIPGLLTGGFKAISGMNQVREGKRLASQNVRPTYRRPGEVITAEAIAERNYLNGMPGADIARSGINLNAAAAYGAAERGASSGGDLLDAATKIGLNTNQSMGQLAAQEAQYKITSGNAYNDALMKSAAYTDKEFSYNQDDPFQQKAAAASALINSGNKNIFSGLDDVAGMASSVIGSKMIFDPTTGKYRQGS